MSLGGCVENMTLGMAMYGKTYTLVNPDNHDIGDSTSGAGDPGPYTKEAVRKCIVSLNVMNFFVEINRYT